MKSFANAPEKEAPQPSSAAQAPAQKKGLDSPQAMLDGMARGGQQLSGMLQGSAGGLGDMAASLMQGAGGNAAVAGLLGKGKGGGGQDRETAAADAVKLGMQAPTKELPYQDQIEQELGGQVDLSRLEVHTGKQAAEAAGAIGAKAFSVGNQLFFKDDEPKKEDVVHEIAHVVAAGGHEKGHELKTPPGKLPLGDERSPEEGQAQGAERQGPPALMPLVEKGGHGGGPVVRRKVDVAGTGKDVLGSLLKDVVPEAQTQQIEQFKATGSQIQDAVSGVKGVIDQVQAFPVDDVTSLFDGQTWDFLDPKGFEESLKAEGDNFVEQVANVVLGLCESVLKVLDGFLGVINKILGIVNQIISILENIANVLKIISAVLTAIATALAATGFGAGLAAVLFNIANTCYNISSQISSIVDVVKGFIEPINKVVEQLNKIRDVVNKVATVARLVKLACDVYKWATAKTAEERAQAAQGIMENIGSVSETLSMFEGTKFGDFTKKYWDQALPVVNAALSGNGSEIAGAAVQALTGGGGGGGGGGASEQSSGGKDAGGSGGGKEGQMSMDAEGEAVKNFKESEAEEKAKAEQQKKASGDQGGDKGKGKDGKEQPQVDGAKIAKDMAGDGKGKAESGTPHADQAKGSPKSQQPAGDTVQSNNVGEESSVQGSPTGTGSGSRDQALSVSSKKSAAPDKGAPTGLPAQSSGQGAGYPDAVDRALTYLNQLSDHKEVLSQVAEAALDRIKEAEGLIENAQKAIEFAQQIIEVSQGQQESAQQDQQTATEGAGFTAKLQAMSQKLQGQLQEQLSSAIGIGPQATSTGDQGTSIVAGSSSQGKSAEGKGTGAMGIIKKVSTAVLGALLSKVMEKININKMIGDLIPGEVGQVLGFVSNFSGIVTGAKDQAAAKQGEHQAAQGVFQGASATDAQSMQQAQGNQQQGEAIIASAEENIATAQEAIATAQEQKQKSDEEQARADKETQEVEQALEERLRDARALRERQAKPQIEGSDAAQQKNAGPEAAGAGKSSNPNVGVDQNPAGGGRAKNENGPVSARNEHQPVGSQNQTPAGPSSNPNVGVDQNPAGGGSAKNETQGPGQQQGGPSSNENASGGGGGGGGDAGGLDLETKRAEFHKKTQEIAEEQEPPDPAKIGEPIEQGANERIAKHREALVGKLNETRDGLPQVDALKKSLEPLPEVQPQPAPTKQVDPAGLGLGPEKVVVDQDVAKIKQQIQPIPDKEKLIQPGKKDGPGQAEVLQPLTKVKEEIGAKLQEAGAKQGGKEELPASEPAKDQQLETPDPELATPKIEGMKGGPDMEAFRQAQAKLFKELQQKMQQVLDGLTQQVTQLRQQRDTELKGVQTQWSGEVDSLVSEKLGQAQEVGDQAIGASETKLKQALGEGGKLQAEAGKKAQELEGKAHSQVARLKQEAMGKAPTLWGWQPDTVSDLGEQLASGIDTTWSKNREEIGKTLGEAERAATELLTTARQLVLDGLNQALQQIEGIYQALPDELKSVHEQFRKLITELIKKVAEEVEAAKTTADEQIDQTFDELKEKPKELPPNPKLGKDGDREGGGDVKQTEGGQPPAGEQASELKGGGGGPGAQQQVGQGPPGKTQEGGGAGGLDLIAQELAAHESWGVKDSKGAAVAQAFVKGLVGGITQGVIDVGVEALFEAAMKKVPVLGPLVGLLGAGGNMSIIFSSERWKEIGGKWSKLTITNFKTDPLGTTATLFEAIAKTASMVNTIAGTISAIGYAVAGASALLVWICPAVAPLIAPSFQVGKIAGTVATIAGWVSTVATTIAAVLQAVKLLFFTNDPAEFNKGLKDFSKNVAEGTKGVTKALAGNYKKNKQENKNDSFLTRAKKEFETVGKAWQEGGTYFSKQSTTLTDEVKAVAYLGDQYNKAMFESQKTGGLRGGTTLPGYLQKTNEKDSGIGKLLNSKYNPARFGQTVSDMLTVALPPAPGALEDLARLREEQAGLEADLDGVSKATPEMTEVAASTEAQVKEVAEWKAAGEAMKQAATTAATEVAARQNKLTEVKTKVQAQDAQADEAKGKQADAFGQVASVLGGLEKLCNMVPSNPVVDGKGAARKIGDFRKRMEDGNKAFSEFSGKKGERQQAFTQQEQGLAQSKEEQASGKEATSEYGQQVQALNQKVTEAQKDAAAGKKKLEEQKAKLEAAIAKKKADYQSKYQAMLSWAQKHKELREKAGLQAKKEVDEDKKKVLDALKAAEGGGGGGGGGGGAPQGGNEQDPKKKPTAA